MRREEILKTEKEKNHMVCPNCHNQINAKSNQCPYCGTVLFAQQESASSAPSPQSSEPIQHPMEKATQYYAPPEYSGQPPYYPNPGYYYPQPNQPIPPQGPYAAQNVAPSNPWPDRVNSHSPEQPYPAYPYPPQPSEMQTEPEKQTQPPQQAPQQGYPYQPYTPYSAAQPQFGEYAGSAQVSYPAQKTGTVMVKEKKRKIWPIVLICLGSLAVIGTAVTLIVMLLLPPGGGAASPELVADQFVGGMLDGNGEQILSLVPDQMVTQMVEEEGYESREEMADELTGAIRLFLSYLEMLDAPIDYIVGEPEPIEDYILDDLRETYQNYGLSVSNARNVPISFTIDGEATSDISSEGVLTVQINEQWYLDITQS